MKNDISQILDRANKADSNIPPTLLYNEGWMLRVVLKQIAEGKIIHPDLTYPVEGASWYSEALLSSPFAPRTKGDKLAESRTHADGVVGQFEQDDDNKGGIKLTDGCNFFYVTEAKMFSELASRTTNAPHYNQAARNVACIARLIFNNQAVQLDDFKKLGFYLLLPEEQIIHGSDSLKYLQKDHMRTTIKQRLSIYDKKEEQKPKMFDWLNQNLDNFINKVDIKAITWEELVSASSDNSLDDFYQDCLTFNRRVSKSKP